jgi:hypothetical protein
MMKHLDYAQNNIDYGMMYIVVKQAVAGYNFGRMRFGSWVVKNLRITVLVQK